MPDHHATADPRNALIVRQGSSFRLGDVDPADTSLAGSKEAAADALDEHARCIAKLQLKLYAERSRALLVILQGMDTSGKDGTVRHVFGRTSPLGIAVTSFQKPTPEEMSHDFLWRVHRACPQRGTIGIFNRSHYEDVLVGRVRNLADPEVIERRYGQINAFEDMIASSTRIVKIMLHISADEQKKRLQARLDTPKKRWKFDPGDLEDRALWDEYQAAYETILQRCGGETAPWYVVPSDHKWSRNALVASIVRHTLEDMAPAYPVPAWDPDDFKVR